MKNVTFFLRTMSYSYCIQDRRVWTAIKVTEGYKETPERRGLLVQLGGVEIKEPQDPRVNNIPCMNEYSIFNTTYK